LAFASSACPSGWGIFDDHVRRLAASPQPPQAPNFMISVKSAQHCRYGYGSTLHAAQTACSVIASATFAMRLSPVPFHRAFTAAASPLQPQPASPFSAVDHHQFLPRHR
jgi:hypothetical protein